MIGLDQDEHIIFEIRKHWFVFATEITSLLLLGIAPLIILAVLNNLQIQIEILNGGFISLIIFLYTFWIFILWVIGFIFWTDYYLDIWVVTNKKILDVEQNGLFNREVSILHLDKVQDITSDVRGVFATFMNYGDIHVQTAGQQREFIIKNVPNADETRKRINDSLMRYVESIR
jgi:membrane protein YdbS with pleckstrin-like domain